MHMIRGILIKPYELPVLCDFEEGLESLQRIVNGPIEMPYLFDDVEVVINEEGKINGSLPNRFLFYNNELVDILFGNILIVDVSPEGSIISLNKEKADKYLQKFQSADIDL